MTIRNKAVVSAKMQTTVKRKKGFKIAAPPVSPAPLVQVAMNGVIPLPSQEAKTFKRQYINGLLRPQVITQPDGKIVRFALINDAENYIMPYENGEFISAESKQKRREQAALEERMRIEKQIRIEKEKILKKESATGLRVTGDTVTDLRTGLIWTRNGNIAGRHMMFEAAGSWIKELDYGGYSDWRLPTKSELKSFIRRGGAEPYEWFNNNGFVNLKNGFYWTNSQSGYKNYIEIVYMDESGRESVSDPENGSSATHYVWPVRDGR